jgi:transcriptional regulator with XRE-family HTH domain
MDKFSIPTAQDIWEAAKSKGWTAKRLCAEAGISDETFFRWRDGRHTISLGKLQALVDALGRNEQSP